MQRKQLQSGSPDQSFANTAPDDVKLAVCHLEVEFVEIYEALFGEVERHMRLMEFTFLDPRAALQRR